MAIGQRSPWGVAQSLPQQPPPPAPEPSSLTEAALSIASEGLPVFPCNAAKKPLVEHGFKDATCDPAKIREMFARPGAALIAIPTGHITQRVVVDVDPRHAGDAWLAQNENALPPTRVHSTPSGGQHFVFRTPLTEIRNSASRIAPGVDVRGEGGYAIVPPSPGYAVIDDAEPADMPEWLIAACLPPVPQPSPRPAVFSRPEEITDARIRGLVSALLDNIRAAPDGTKHSILRDNARALGGCLHLTDWSEADAAELLVGALPASVEDWNLARRTALDGLRNGQQHPLELEDRPNPFRHPHAGSNGPSPEAEAQRAGSVNNAWPDPLGLVAFPGIAGEFVATLHGNTEADPAALLFQFLTAFGNAIGNGAFYVVENDEHPARLNVLLIGPTAKARKGTAWGRVRGPFRDIEPAWTATRIVSGLSSGEGLITAVRDERRETNDEGEEIIVDPGEPDKRLLVVSSEFAGVLRNMARIGNTLSAVLRDAWDIGRSGTLQTLTRHNKLIATGPHISQIAHITADELRRYLDATETANGFANRYLCVCVRRAKTLLPMGGKAIDWSPFAEQLAQIISTARRMGQVMMDADARDLWCAEYRDLSEGRPGLLGAIIGRAEAQVVRLALIYALLDQSRTIGTGHLQAALECWRYAEQSARFIFHDALGDPIADTILAHLRQADDGLTQTEISELFGRHVEAGKITRALQSLQLAGLAASQKRGTGGRSATVWKAVRKPESAK